MDRPSIRFYSNQYKNLDKRDNFIFKLIAGISTVAVVALIFTKPPTPEERAQMDIRNYHCPEARKDLSNTGRILEWGSQVPLAYPFVKLVDFGISKTYQHFETRPLY